jgi:hypothetical protein
MSANSGRGAGRNGGRGRGRGSGRTGRGNDYSGSASSNKKGLCSALGNHVFDYGQRGSADQTKTSYETLTRHAGTVFGPDIGNELQNRQRLVIPEPTYSAEAIAANQAATLRRNTQHQRIEAARKAKSLALAEKIKQGDTDAMLEQAILLNEMEEADHKANLPIPITLEGSEYTKHSNEWRTYRERVSSLEKHRGQAFSMLRGQCMEVLLDKMKYEPGWDTVSTSYDPLALMSMIERVVLSQTADQYPYATVYEQELTLYTFSQQDLSNQQWYDVGSKVAKSIVLLVP